MLAGQHTEQNLVLESIPMETVRSLRYVTMLALALAFVSVLPARHSDSRTVLIDANCQHSFLNDRSLGIAVAECRKQFDGLEQDFLAIADLLFNLHYGPALEQLLATELDAETLLAFTRESVEDVTLALGCCAKRQVVPRHDADEDDLTREGGDGGFAFRLLAIALAFFGTICCVQVRYILLSSQGATSVLWHGP